MNINKYECENITIKFKFDNIVRYLMQFSNDNDYFQQTGRYCWHM